MSTDSLTGTEKRAALSLAGIFALRMLGLFMIYPVFAPWARHLPDATAVTIGLALGVYGLTQAVLQIPFGFLSDRIGRKPVIAAGLLLFAVGSVIAALSPSIDGIVLGRLLQGAGAVGSTVLALAADLTLEEHRTRAMALIGMTIGLAFGVAVVLGPVLTGWIGVRGIFWLTAVLAGLGIAVLYLLVPRTDAHTLHRDAEPVPALFRRVLADRELRRLDVGIFSQHAILTASFLTIPFLLAHAGVALHHQWWVYLPVLVASIVLLVPLVSVAERGRMKPVFLAAIGLLAAGQVLFPWGRAHLSLMVLGLILFFTAFNVLESVLPSLVSRLAPADAKGTAMGVYSSSQFFGIFVGGVLGGSIDSRWGVDGVVAFCIVVAVLWWLVAWRMRPPAQVSNRTLRVAVRDEREARKLEEKLRQVPGVLEAVVVHEEGVAYVRAERSLDLRGLTAAIAG
ncbi:MAG: Inner membrane transport protein YajR [Rhodanobacteraceae bacterium]|nr:MAG: Inner membrane transport protein YajR [Rhodanobacteraceae bacterium]